VSVFANEVFPTIGELGALVGAIINLVSFVGTIETLENMEYWGITYITGYLIGIILVQPVFGGIESILYLLVGGLYLAKKILNKF